MNIPWNKGLTKHTDIRLKKCSENIRKGLQGNIPWNKGKGKYLNRYGLSPTQVTEFFNKYNNVCGICGKSETIAKNGKVQKLSIDHDHKTGKIRGLLCNRCNFAIGILKDDMNIHIIYINIL